MTQLFPDWPQNAVSYAQATATKIGPHRLYLGDAYAIRPALGWFDADVMDPPYVIRTSGGGSFRKDRPYLDQIQSEGLDRGFDHAIINPLLCGAVIVFCHNDQMPSVSATVDGLFHRMALCVWQKSTPMPVANKHYVPNSNYTFMHGIGAITPPAN